MFDCNQPGNEVITDSAVLWCLPAYACRAEFKKLLVQFTLARGYVRDLPNSSIIVFANAMAGHACNVIRRRAFFSIAYV